MYSRILKSIVLTSLTALMAVPAVAQIRADLGPLRIRIADNAPPRARYERRMARPDRNSVWINGYWDRQDHNWVWISGRWEQPADRRHNWVRPRYQREGRAWRYEPGHWSNQQLTEDEEYQQWKLEHRSGGRR
jgi:hypothetical protein